MYPEPSTRKTWSPFFTGRAAGDAAAAFAGENLAGLAVFDFAGAGMARMWAVVFSLSIGSGAAVDRTFRSSQGRTARNKRAGITTHRPQNRQPVWYHPTG